MNHCFSRLSLEFLILLLGLVLISGCSQESSRSPTPTLTGLTADKVEPILTFIVHGDTHSGYDFRNPEVPSIHPAFIQAIGG